MRASRGCFTVLIAVALGLNAARADDPHPSKPEDPDPGFLEFLGGVDGLADANPDYLQQAAVARAPQAQAAAPRPAPPPPASPPAPPGTKNNE
jgi:hypothetical protein